MISANILGSEQVKIDPRRVPSSFVFTGFGLIVDGCCLQDVGVSVQPFALPTMAALVSSHTVGRVWGTCWEVLSCNYSAAEPLSCWFQNVSYAPGWCGILPFWPTHPDARMYDSETMR